MGKPRKVVTNLKKSGTLYCPECHKGAVIVKAGYRGGRKFGEIPNVFVSFYCGIKYYSKIAQ